MPCKDKWIWLDSKKYPDMQRTAINALGEKKAGDYGVAQFIKKYKFAKKVKKVSLRISGDTEFRLNCNGVLVATGPVNVGGDFLADDKVRPTYYATVAEIFPEGKELCFEARVRMMPLSGYEFSKGRGGFMLSGRVELADGKIIEISTDETWLGRKNNYYRAPDFFDTSVKNNEYSRVCVVEDVWNCTDAPIKPRIEFYPFLQYLSFQPGEKGSVTLELPELCAGFLNVISNGQGHVELKIECLEADTVNCVERFVFTEKYEYIGTQLRSIGKIKVTYRNMSFNAAKVGVGVIATCYPVEGCAQTVTSDIELNGVLELCRRNLKYCRQLIHLDSPLHCEPLACTGDYYIEMLMTAFSYGDLSLAEFDIIRTAEVLRFQKGEMFHVTYSMIWLLMLYDAYLFTGNIRLLEDCADAAELLLKRFEQYIGQNGLIETPPSYMFVDWLYVDEISLHHPPKALGQTCLNMFFYGGLCAAKKIFKAIGEDEKAENYKISAENLRKNINIHLFDAQKGLYFEGLNTPTPQELIYHYMPQNVNKRYFRKHANVLAACFGVCENGTELLDRVLSDDSLGDFQPYFGHFVFQAVRNTGLSSKYTLPLLERWKESARKCSVGLAEGFIEPEPGYKFDYSHAWAGTPLCSLPLALTGLEIIEPGFKKIRIKPNLSGLDFADIQIPTPYGYVNVKLKKGKEPQISAPKEVKII